MLLVIFVFLKIFILNILFYNLKFFFDNIYYGYIYKLVILDIFLFFEILRVMLI